MRFTVVVIAFSAAVSGNYLTLTARHLIQTLPTLEKKNETRRGKKEGEERRKRIAEKGKKSRGGDGQEGGDNRGEILSLYLPLNASSLNASVN